MERSGQKMLRRLSRRLSSRSSRAKSRAGGGDAKAGGVAVAISGSISPKADTAVLLGAATPTETGPISDTTKVASSVNVDDSGGITLSLEETPVELTPTEADVMVVAKPNVQPLDVKVMLGSPGGADGSAGRPRERPSPSRPDLWVGLEVVSVAKPVVVVAPDPAATGDNMAAGPAPPAAGPAPPAAGPAAPPAATAATPLWPRAPPDAKPKQLAFERPQANVDELLRLHAAPIAALKAAVADMPQFAAELSGPVPYDELFLLRFLLSNGEKGAEKAVRATLKYRGASIGSPTCTLYLRPPPLHCQSLHWCPFGGGSVLLRGAGWSLVPQPRMLSCSQRLRRGRCIPITRRSLSTLATRTQTQTQTRTRTRTRTRECPCPHLCPLALTLTLT